MSGISEQIGELFATLGFKIDAAGLKGFEKRLESLEKQIRSMGKGQKAIAEDATKAAKDQRIVTEEVVKATGKQAKAVKSLDKAYKDMYKNQAKHFKAVVANIGGKGGDSPMTQFMRQMSSGVSVKGNNAGAWASQFKRSVDSLVSQSKPLAKKARQAQQAMYDGLFGNPSAVANNAKEWQNKFRGTVAGLGPQAQSDMSKYYSALSRQEKQLAAQKAKQAEQERRIKRQELIDQTRLLNQERIRQNLVAQRLRMEQQSQLFQARMQQMQQRISSRSPINGITSGNPNHWGGGFVGAVAGAAATGFGLSGLWSQTQDLVSGNMRLQAVTGGPAEGVAAQEWLVQQAQRLGFDYRSIMPEYAGFLAPAGQRIGIPEAQNVFRAFSELGTVRKLSTFERKKMFYALKQMYSKNKVMSEELSQQMAEGGFADAVNVFEQAWKDMGQTSSLQDAMKEGNVKTADIMPYVIQILDRMNASALPAAMQSSIAAHGRMATNYGLSLQTFIDSGGEKAFGNLWDDIADGLARATPLTKAFGEAFDALLTPLQAAAKLFGDIGQVYLPMLSQATGVSKSNLTTLAVVAGGLLFPFTRMLTVLSLLIVAFEDISVGIQGGESYFRDFVTWIGGGEFNTGLERLEKYSKILLAIAGSAKVLSMVGGLDKLGGGAATGFIEKVAGAFKTGVIYVAAIALAGAVGVAIGTALSDHIRKEDWFIEFADTLFKNIDYFLAQLGIKTSKENLMSRGIDTETSPSFLTHPMSWAANHIGGLFSQGPAGNGRFPDWINPRNERGPTASLTMPLPPQVTFGDISVSVPINSLDISTDLNNVANKLGEAIRSEMENVAKDAASNVFNYQLNTTGMNFSGAYQQ